MLYIGHKLVFLCLYVCLILHAKLIANYIVSEYSGHMRAGGVVSAHSPSTCVCVVSNS